MIDLYFAKFCEELYFSSLRTEALGYEELPPIPVSTMEELRDGMDPTRSGTAAAGGVPPRSTAATHSPPGRASTPDACKRATARAHLGASERAEASLLPGWRSGATSRALSLQGFYPASMVLRGY